MKQNKTFAKIFIGFTMITIITLVGFHNVFAATAVTKTTTTTTTTKATPIVSDTTKTAVTEKATGFWDSVKAFGNKIYTAVDAWRAGQETSWRALRTSKQDEITTRNSAMDAGIQNRVDKVLAGEQASIVQGSVKDFDWHIFLLKLYVAALTVFVFIFAYPIAFYGIAIVVILLIIRQIYQRVRYGY